MNDDLNKVVKAWVNPPKLEYKQRITHPKKKKVFVVNPNPATPFEALRQNLKLTLTELAKLSGINYMELSYYERGYKIPKVDKAKCLQEISWKLGIPVTLDELYSHIATYQKKTEI